MTDALLIRPATPADTDGIVDLLRLGLGTGEIPRERSFWEWKHEQSPFGASPVLVAEHAGELVGLRAFLRWEWRQSHGIVRAVRAVDTATHPRWQGRGIFSRLTQELVREMIADQVHFVFNTPNEKSRPGYLKMGWRQVGRLDLWLRPVSPLRLLGLAVGRAAGPPAWPRTEARDDSVGRLCEHPDLERFLECVRATRIGTRLWTARSRAYLRWRYADVPGFPYHAKFAFNGEQGAALIYRGKRQGTAAELRICELLVGPTKDSVHAAVSMLRELRRAEGADFFSAMSAPGTRERSALLASGFLPAFRLGPAFTVRRLAPLPDTRSDPASRRAWRFSIGDLELF